MKKAVQVDIERTTSSADNLARIYAQFPLIDTKHNCRSSEIFNIHTFLTLECSMLFGTYLRVRFWSRPAPTDMSSRVSVPAPFMLALHACFLQRMSLYRLFLQAHHTQTRLLDRGLNTRTFCKLSSIRFLSCRGGKCCH